MTRRIIIPLAVALGTSSLLVASACGGGKSEAIRATPYCSDESGGEPPEISGSVTWHADVAPIVEGRCAHCHRDGGIGPFPITDYEEAFGLRESIRDAVVHRRMPPWLPADCCNEFRDDFSLTPEQIATIDAWVERGAPEGSPDEAAEPLTPVGGLSRVDVTVEMDEGYTPDPEPGRVDDFRCFVLDWPLEETAYVTGVEPIPGAREILHHMIIGYVTGDDRIAAVEEAAARDDTPGFDCEGGLGDLQLTGILGGSLLGGDFPDDLGHRIEPNSKIVLDVHYSVTDSAPAQDRTKVRFRIDDSARESHTIPLANPIWLAGRSMHIPAGASGVRHDYQFDPRLFTGGKPAKLWGFTPHMHYLGERMRVAVIRDGEVAECLTEIPRWDFGWEQPYWFAEPITLQPDDELYIECIFDNTRENQPIIGGERPEPRDIAWGSDNQEMCAGFLAYTLEE